MTKSLKFIDLFAGLGGFHLALKKLNHKCVFACEIDEELRYLYEKNFSLMPKGDIRSIHAKDIPHHDILCAGFPCQPFSKAGEQLGTQCKLWGDLFSRHVLRIIKHHHPQFIIMENVANLEHHNGGQTWRNMKKNLEQEGYAVQTKILSPHKFKVPQIRERLFIIGSLQSLDHFYWPRETRQDKLNIKSVLDKDPNQIKPLPKQVIDCLKVWQEFLRLTPTSMELPSFPIWTMEFGATYPYRGYNSLYDIPLKDLRNYKGSFGCKLNKWNRSEILNNVPKYAQGKNTAFPLWKQHFISKNREYYLQNRNWIDPWLPKIKQYPSSFQKLEWNCKGEIRNIRKHIVQFRASGVRIKRPTTAPSLVAMTTTQIPIITWEDRFMTPKECSRLQSMGSLKYLPDTLTKSCKALGNAINVDVAFKVAKQLCS